MTNFDDQKSGVFPELLQQLTGQKPPFGDQFAPSLDFPATGIGYSQFNEILLLHGYQRITDSFFQFLVDGTVDYVDGTRFTSITNLRNGIVRFRKHAMLRHGSFVKGFNKLADCSYTELRNELILPIDETHYSQRSDPVLNITPIPLDEAHLLGYLVERELDRRYENDPLDKETLRQRQRRSELIDVAEQNHRAYLASDHMDVYVATSMRHSHEYTSVGRFCTDLFGHKAISHLKLRYFDPTQAVCDKRRIDKGLSEALMLKRAKCTIYLVQESDTFGKDSELASTLAQGKTVIAFVPKLDKDSARKQLDLLLNDMDNELSQRDKWILLARTYCPDLAWTKPDQSEDADVINRLVCEPGDILPNELVADLYRILTNKMIAHYDSRAATLRDFHPLGLQVSLETGVALGVLVARSLEQCASLLKGIVTNTLEFDLEEDPQHGTLLREQISECVFRVVTRDALLTNAFWNFYPGM